MERNTEDSLYLTGRIEGTRIIEIGKRLESFQYGEAARLVVDMSGVTFVDSAGLGGLMYAAIVLKRAGKALTVRGLNPTLAELFHDTHADNVLTIEGHALPTEARQ